MRHLPAYRLILFILISLLPIPQALAEDEHNMFRKLHAFERAFKDIQGHPDFFGVELSVDGKTLYLICRPGSELAKSLRAKILSRTAVDEQTQYQVNEVSVVEQNPYEIHQASPLVEGGTEGWGQGLQGVGTIGWSIILDEEPVMISNSHVFCPRGNDTPLGTPIMATGATGTGSVGRLAYCYPMTQSNNLWDLAIAKYLPSVMPSGQMRSCEDGSRLPYPMKLGFTDDLFSGDTHWTIGSTSPICSNGKLVTVGSATVDYGEGVLRQFKDQLIFEKISQGGDSGSIVINERTRQVIGLLFAGSKEGQERKVSLANPLYRKEWSYEGTRTVGTSVLPVFRSLNKEAHLIYKQAGAQKGLAYPPAFATGKVCTPYNITEVSKSRNMDAFEIQKPFSEDWIEVVFHAAFNGLNVVKDRLSGWLHIPSGLLYRCD